MEKLISRFKDVEEKISTMSTIPKRLSVEPEDIKKGFLKVSTGDKVVDYGPGYVTRLVEDLPLPGYYSLLPSPQSCSGRGAP